MVGDEREAEYRGFLHSIAGSLAPADALEAALAERAATALWRLKRVTRYEDELIALSLERVDQDVLPHVPGGLTALEQRLRERVLHAKRLRRFPALPDDKRMLTGTALAIVFAVAAEAPAVHPERISLPGYGGSIRQVNGWTAGRVRAAIAGLAALNREARPDDARDARALLAGATVSAAATAAALHKEVRLARRAAARLARERSGPPADVVERIMRYEGHVARQLAGALHELAVIQRQRRGGEAGLARVEAPGEGGVG